MKEVNIPLPIFNDDDLIEINVLVGKEKNETNFRIVSFTWKSDAELTRSKEKDTNSMERIERLKISIKNYDSAWELLQIFAPLENSRYIHVLYRKKA